MTLEVILTGKDVRAGFFNEIDTANSKLKIDSFPDDTRVGTLTVNANIRRLYGLGDRYMKKGIVQKFEGSIGVDMPLYSKDFLDKLLTQTDVGDLFVVYPTFGRYIKSVVPQRVEISIREDEMVRLSFDGVFVSEKDFDVSNGTVNSTLEIDGTDVNTYSIVFNDVVAYYPTHVNASISGADGVTNVTIRSATIRVNLNNELKWGIGSRIAQAVVPRQVEIEVTIEAILSKSMLDKVLADTQDGSVSITFELKTDNSESATTFAKIIVDGAYLDSVAEPIEPNTEVYATLTYIGKSISVTT